MHKKITAEILGTAFLLVAIVGSAIQMQRMSTGLELNLEGHAVAIGLTLAVMIAAFVKVSGAHFNPAVTIVMAWRKEIGGMDALTYIGAQFVGAVLGVAIAHWSFGLPAMEPSMNPRGGELISEVVATFGLVMVLLAVRGYDPKAMPWAVGLYLTAAIMFSNSTAFANPAVTFARTLTDSVAGIHSSDSLMFIAAQVVGGLAAAGMYKFMGGK